VRIKVSLFSGQILEGATAVKFAPRERELILSLAAQQMGIKTARQSSAGSVRVLVSRIRSRFAEPIVEAVGAGQYRLTSEVEIDLQQMRRGVLAVTTDGADSKTWAESLGEALDQLRANPLLSQTWFRPVARQLETILRDLLAEVIGSSNVAMLR
jgi:hypothetical protein